MGRAALAQTAQGKARARGGKPAVQPPAEFDTNPILNFFETEAIASFTLAGQCESVTPNTLSVFGKKKPSILRGGFLKQLAQRDAEKFLAFLASPSRSHPIRLQCNAQWLELRAVESGKTGCTLLIQNITEHVKQASALRKASLEAELALRGQSEFFAHISHELRTPLNAILGFSEMMVNEMFGNIGNERYRDYVEIMQQSSYQLLNKINDLLEMSALSANMEQLNEKPLMLEELVKSAIQVHARDIFRQHLNIKTNIARCTLVADKLKMQQALTHLLHNAVKFSPEDATLWISAEITEEGGLCLTIEDEGCGFDSRQLDYMNKESDHFAFFERNRRLIGFGLPLARELVYLHGGTLQCHNSEDGGACVSLLLPRERIIGARGYTTTSRQRQAEAC